MRISIFILLLAAFIHPSAAFEEKIGFRQFADKEVLANYIALRDTIVEECAFPSREETELLIFLEVHVREVGRDILNDIDPIVQDLKKKNKDYLSGKSGDEKRNICFGYDREFSRGMRSIVRGNVKLFLDNSIEYLEVSEISELLAQISELVDQIQEEKELALGLAIAQGEVLKSYTKTIENASQEWVVAAYMKRGSRALKIFAELAKDRIPELSVYFEKKAELLDQYALEGADMLQVAVKEKALGEELLPILKKYDSIPAQPNVSKAEREANFKFLFNRLPILVHAAAGIPDMKSVPSK